MAARPLGYSWSSCTSYLCLQDANASTADVWCAMHPEEGKVKTQLVVARHPSDALTATLSWLGLAAAILVQDFTDSVKDHWMRILCRNSQPILLQEILIRFQLRHCLFLVGRARLSFHTDHHEQFNAEQLGRSNDASQSFLRTSLQDVKALISDACHVEALLERLQLGQHLQGRGLKIGLRRGVAGLVNNSNKKWHQQILKVWILRKEVPACEQLSAEIHGSIK